MHSGALNPAATPAPAPRRSRAVSVAPASSGGLGLWLVYAAWATLLMDLHYFVGIIIAPPLQTAATVLFGGLIVLIALQGPTILASMKSWVWYPPFVLLLGAAAASLPIAINTGLARGYLQYLVIYYVVIVATALYVKTPRQALPILAILCWRFVWWAVWTRRSFTAGAPGMGITWHPTMANYDGFGGLMVQGAAVCYWFGMAARSRVQRFLLFLLAAYCVAGVVGSYARGAFLALCIVVFLVWLRSPRKLLTGMGLVGAAIVVLAAAALLFDAGAFWQEMATVFQEGTEEGTGETRMILWGAATRVWMEYPIFGVGLGNWGVFASQFFRPGEIPGFDNPNAFWGMNTHNAYFQLLAELGIVGLAAFIWCIVDFFIKNRALSQPEAVARWNSTDAGHKFDLRYLGLGLEGAMVATILVNMVYASLFEPWFISIWAANRMLWALVARDTVPASKGVGPPAAGRRMARRPFRTG